MKVTAKTLITVEYRIPPAVDDGESSRMPLGFGFIDEALDDLKKHLEDAGFLDVSVTQELPSDELVG